MERVFLRPFIYNAARLHSVIGRIAMRPILLAVLSGVGFIASVQTVAARSQPTSPIVCETPKLDALSQEVKRQLHVKLCVQTDILVDLNGTGSALATAVHSYAPFPEANGSTTDPNGITCHRPWNGKLECAFNSFWSATKANTRRRAFFSQGSNPNTPAFETMANGVSLPAGGQTPPR